MWEGQRLEDQVTSKALLARDDTEDSSYRFPFSRMERNLH